MTISLLQLNINADNFWENLIPFLKRNDFDILSLQEIAGKGTSVGNLHCKRDCYKALQTILGEKYHGEFAIAERFTSSIDAYVGNTIFYKKAFTLIDKQIVTIKKTKKPFPSDAKSFEKAGRNALHLTLQKEDKTISIICTHGAWAKNSEEHEHQTEQGNILLDYLRTVPQPFVLTGDFNLNPKQPLIQKINTFTKNLITEHNITNTLNPRTHGAKKLFPLGLAVDYIFVSKDIAVSEFNVITEDISDHFGLSAKIEI